MKFKNVVFLLLILILIGCAATNSQKDGQSGPVTIEAVESALKAGVNSKLIAKKIREKGVNFELNKENTLRLKKAKANKIVINAIREANMKK